MAFIVEMIHGKPGDSDFQIVYCSDKNWKNIMAMGQAHGWKPSGSVLESTLHSSQPVKSDYKPSSWGDDYKVFLREDALALSVALRKLVNNANFENQQRTSRPLLITDQMDEKMYQQVNNGLSASYLQEVIEFLRRGEFIFVWDD